MKKLSLAALATVLVLAICLTHPTTPANAWEPAPAACAELLSVSLGQEGQATVLTVGLKTNEKCGLFDIRLSLGLNARVLNPKGLNQGGVYTDKNRQDYLLLIRFRLPKAATTTIQLRLGGLSIMALKELRKEVQVVQDLLAATPADRVVNITGPYGTRGELDLFEKSKSWLVVARLKCVVQATRNIWPRSGILFSRDWCLRQFPDLRSPSHTRPARPSGAKCPPGTKC